MFALLTRHLSLLTVCLTMALFAGGDVKRPIEYYGEGEPRKTGRRKRRNQDSVLAQEDDWDRCRDDLPLDVVLEQRILKNALHQLANADIDDPDWQPIPLADLAKGLTDYNSDEYDDVDSGIEDLPPVSNPPSGYKPPCGDIDVASVKRP